MNVSESSFHVRGDNIIDDRYCLCRDLGFSAPGCSPVAPSRFSDADDPSIDVGSQSGGDGRHRCGSPGSVTLVLFPMSLK